MFRKDSAMRTIEDMKKLFAEKGYNLLDEVYNNNKQYLSFEKDGYIYYNTYNGFIKTTNPKKWSAKNPYSIQNLRTYLCKEDVQIKIPDQSYNYDKLEAVCSCGNHYFVSWDNFINTKQYQCPDCGRKKSAKNHVKDIYIELMKEKELQSIEEYKGCKHTQHFKLSNGYIIKTSMYQVKHNGNIEDTIFDICNDYTIDNMQLYLRDNIPSLKLLSNTYTGAKSRYTFLCECGRQFEAVWQTVYFGQKSKCEYCTKFASSLAVKTEQWLNEHSIAYKKEKTYPDCQYKGKLRFDYYLPEFNSIVEIDGNQHDKPVRFGNMTQEEAEKAFVETQIRDRIKNEYCKKNNIPLLRIKQKEFATEEYKTKLQTFTS